MEMKEKHSRKPSDGEKDVLSSVDRLSDLPDSVLTHILSFLPTKRSVRTSILSKRWRYLWSYVPTLYLNCFVNQDTLNRVMLLYKAQRINSFSLSYDREFECSAYQLETWVIFAVRRHVQKLHLRLPFEVGLPPCLFTCKTLVDLCLNFSGVIPMSTGAVCLPRLKKLNLHCSCENIEPDEYLPRILTGCPVLEELTIEIYTAFVSCTISSPIMKRLSVNFSQSTSSVSNNGDYRLVIDTPALLYLKVVDYSCESIKSGELTSLIEADIYLYNDDEEIQDQLLYARSLVEFIDRLCNVKSLKLILRYYPQIIDSVFSASMTKSFCNLIKLELTNSGDCCFFSKFVENADNLEMIILREVGVAIANGLFRWSEPKQVPKCFLSHLRTVRLCSYQGTDLVFKIVGYILRNAKVLERVEIPCSRFASSKEKILMFEKVSRLERRSSTCKVVLIS